MKYAELVVTMTVGTSEKLAGGVLVIMLELHGMFHQCKYCLFSSLYNKYCTQKQLKILNNILN